MNVKPTYIFLMKKAIRHFFLVGRCDGAKPGRSYYSDFVEQVPEDCVVLTLACGKFRISRGTHKISVLLAVIIKPPASEILSVIINNKKIHFLIYVNAILTLKVYKRRKVRGIHLIPPIYGKFSEQIFV